MSGSGLGAFDHHQQAIHNVLPLGGLDDGLSSIIPLIGGGVFNPVGAAKIWFDMSCWAEMLLAVTANVASAANGLVIRWSHDGGVTEDVTLRTVATLGAGVEYYQAFARRARHVSIDLTNGAGAQAALSLRTFFFQTPALAGTGGGGNVTIIAPLSYQPPANPVAVMIESPFSGDAPGVPVNIADNLVHELTNPAGAGLQMGHHFVFTQIGGADLQVYLAAAAPAIAVLRRSPYHLFSGIPWEFCPHDAGLHVFVGKAIDGTANADVYRGSSDGGTGL